MRTLKAYKKICDYVPIFITLPTYYTFLIAVRTTKMVYSNFTHTKMLS